MEEIGQVKKMDKNRRRRKILEWHPTTKGKIGKRSEDWLKQTRKDTERRNLEDIECNNREA